MIGKRVRMLRLAMNLTQAQLAEMVGTDRLYISQMETGHRSPGTPMVVKLAQALQVSTDTLLTEQEAA